MLELIINFTQYSVDTYQTPKWPFIHLSKTDQEYLVRTICPRSKSGKSRALKRYFKNLEDAGFIDKKNLNYWEWNSSFLVFHASHKVEDIQALVIREQMLRELEEHSNSSEEILRAKRSLTIKQTLNIQDTVIVASNTSSINLESVIKRMKLTATQRKK
ncbi:MAG: hypothetical protein AAF673_06005 [Pseudomonadota bacterium]